MGTRERRWLRSSTTAEGAVKRAILAARDERRITPHDEPLVTLAGILAVQLDLAAAEDRAGDVARLVKPLRELLNDLPLRAEEIPRRPGADTPPDPVDVELRRLIAAAPALDDMDDMDDTPETPAAQHPGGPPGDEQEPGRESPRPGS